MRGTSLLTLSRGLATVPRELLPSFEAQISEREEPLDEVKPHEAACICAVVEELRAVGLLDAHHYAGFAYSFRIPQISSEFDLLKVSDDAVLNIELKAEDVGEERVARQLRRNRHYLGPLARQIYAFTYVMAARSWFEMGEDGALTNVDARRVVDVLRSMGRPYDGPMENLFRASDYLVSLLNDTEKFLASEYFLTNHQEQIKGSFLRACERARSAAEQPAYIVYGSAGTGKSLLLYDIAKSMSMCRRVCVVHCGVLVEGHRRLNDSQDSFEVVSAKGSERMDFSGFGAVLVDEAQRMWPSQLRGIVGTACRIGLPLFVSLDRRQVLDAERERGNVEDVIGALIPQVRIWHLSRKVRTNRQLTGFVRTLFGLRGHRPVTRTRHVKVAYAEGPAQASELVGAFRDEGFEYVRLGLEVPEELAIDGCLTTNASVGQEFDRVVMAVGPEFVLGDEESRDKAIYRNHVFQGVTRARSDLALVVYDNPELLARLLQIVT